MSTRGAVGIRMNDFDKVGYNHFDSYPEGLGKNLLTWIQNMKNEKNLIKFYDKIILEDRSKSDDWVFNREKCEMNSKFSDSSKFLINSLSCEWAYIINLDTHMFEVYQGFNTDPNANGRYASRKIDDMYIDGDTVYYGVKLIEEYPLEDIFKGKSKFKKDFLKE